MDSAKWASNWQHTQHAVSFDFRAAMPLGTLTREYESFNDVTLLRDAIQKGFTDIAEIGCATGEFFRYLRAHYPQVRYRGFDISAPAIQRAFDKYPGGPFTRLTGDVDTLAETVRREGTPSIVYCKDVVHHQVRPKEFLKALLGIPKDVLILRTRTRDVGATEYDPEKSCQYHYDGPVPYIVMNIDELTKEIQSAVPGCEIAMVRHHMILGGLHNRKLPDDCSRRETGTAETAVAVFYHSTSPGKVRMEDRVDTKPAYTFSDRIWFGTERFKRMFR